MRFSEAWLKEWVDPKVDVNTLADALSMAGLEVDAIMPAAPEFDGVVVGLVVDCQPHPNADKLSLCQVDVGQASFLQIICGAKNVAAGMKVPVALVGAHLPRDLKIKKVKLRGVESYGMICSAAELGLAESSDGIMPLPEDAPLGEDFRRYLHLDDHLIEVDLTPDRGDCLSIAGMAREVGVIFRKPVMQWPLEPIEATIEQRMDVQLEAGTACPRYTCRVIRGIDPKAPTPLWMQERLRRGGIRSLGAVVDVTNYVMLELGQPMHAFDLHRIEGAIRVYLANGEERFELLDGSTCAPRPGTLLIADREKPLALAGIMGGQASAVSASTQDIVLESAFFTPTAIIGKARAHGLHTDSSHRFERGVDPQLQRDALERATDLLLSIVGGQAGPIVETVHESALPEQPWIVLRRSQIPRILGVEIADAHIEAILQRLGMVVEMHSEGWRVQPPSARFDITIEADLIEEVGRIYGYANIPERQGTAPMQLRAEPETAFRLARAKQLLVDRDYQEVITYSFISLEQARSITPEAEPIRLANPISNDMAIMRASLWPGLLATLQYNLARQQERVRLFESGQVFLANGKEIEQPAMLGGLIYGEALPAQWCQPARKADFYDLKGDVEALLALTGDSRAFAIREARHPALHPGQSAAVWRGERRVGYLGMLHPHLQKDLAIGQSVFLFELALDGLEGGRLPHFEAISKFPSVRRDLAILVDESTPWARVEHVVWEAAPEYLQAVHLFDRYTGENIESGRKSFALSLIFQDYSHTLTDDEIDSAMAAILAALESKLAAKLRD